MKSLFRVIAAFLLVSVAVGHDMWLETESFFIKPGKKVIVRNGNGTIYDKSENAVTADRLAVLMGVNPSGGTFQVSEPSVKGNWLNIPFVGSDNGNYLMALASKERKIRLSGEDFTGYLEHDGIPNILKEREDKGITDREEIEQYSKYVKILLQVGDTQTDNFDDPLGLAIEIIPLKNPYALKVGAKLPVQVLFQRKPLAGLTLHAGYDKDLSKTQSATTNSQGRAEFQLASSGKWFIRGIHLSQVDKEDHSYESYWASFTFEMK